MRDTLHTLNVRPISLTCQLAKVLEGFTLARV